MKRLFIMLIIILSGFMIASCNSRHVADKPDTTRPTIIAKSPDSNASGVPVNTTITVTFSEAMNASTINDASFYVVKTGATATVVGTVTYDTASSVATFTTSTLDYNTPYTVTITTTIKDASGNALNSLSSWSFTTIRADHLDTTFGSGGKARIALSSGDDIAYAATIQSGGKIITAGLSAVPSYSFTIARFQTNGLLDMTFSPPVLNGKNDYFTGMASAVALQSDGKIVAAGSSGDANSSDSDFLIARYHSDGSRDTSFGTLSNGSSIVDMGGKQDYARALAIQPDEKIIVAGEATDNSGLNYRIVIARLKSDGTLDDLFGTAGIITNSTYTTSRAYLVKIQSDGRILVGGSYKDVAENNVAGLTSSYLMRFDSAGNLDPSFGSAGVVTVSTGTNTVISAMEVLQSGKILVAGTTTNSTKDIFLMRFEIDGFPDISFGSNGSMTADDDNHGDATAAGLAMQVDGKIIVAATYLPTSGSNPNNDFALFRYSADGVLDTTFGSGGFGMVETDFGSIDYVECVQIQQDGKIVVVGYVWNGLNYDIGLARYWP